MFMSRRVKSHRGISGFHGISWWVDLSVTHGDDVLHLESFQEYPALCPHLSCLVEGLLAPSEHFNIKPWLFTNVRANLIPLSTSDVSSLGPKLLLILILAYRPIMNPAAPAPAPTATSSQFDPSSSPLHPPSVMHNARVLSALATVCSVCYNRIPS